MRGAIADGRNRAVEAAPDLPCRSALVRRCVGLPVFVERELREFLSCGSLARGFARFRCDGCAHEILVAFSCKDRGFCPSCCGRRMAARAAHLADAVLGGSPVRQWGLSLPHRLRFALAFDHRLCRFDNARLCGLPPDLR